MRKTLPILLFLLLYSIHSPAKNGLHFAGGPTISYFLSAENSTPRIGIAFGLIKDFQVYRRLGLSAGVNFASRGAILKQRTIKPYEPEAFEGTYYQNIQGMIGYLGFPVMIQYAIPLTSKIQLQPQFGAVISFPVKDFSRFEEKDLFSLYDPAQSDLISYDFNYEQEAHSFGIIPQIPMTFGLRVDYEKFGFEIRYILDMRDTYHFGRLSDVHYKMHSIYFLVLF
ncbi:MAG: outer membrane beta-barrel protein [Calditrichia bacterium]